MEVPIANIPVDLESRYAFRVDNRKFIYPNRTEYSIDMVLAGTDELKDLYYVNHVYNGDYSSVYTVWDGSEYLIMKISYCDNDEEIPMDSIKSQIDIHSKAAAKGIAPQIKFAFTFEQGGVIVMERLDITLKEYIETATPNMLKSLHTDIIEAIETLHSLHIKHYDLHDENIMFKKTKVYLIDYGFSQHKPEGLSPKDIRWDFFILLEHLQENSKVISLSGEIEKYADEKYPK